MKSKTITFLAFKNVTSFAWMEQSFLYNNSYVLIKYIYNAKKNLQSLILLLKGKKLLFSIIDIS